MGRLRWAKVAGTVGPSTVVVPTVLREHHTQVPLTEDHRAVGEFGSEGAHEPFGDSVRPRTPRWNRPGAPEATVKCKVKIGISVTSGHDRAALEPLLGDERRRWATPVTNRG